MSERFTESSWSIRPWRILAAIFVGVGVCLLFRMMAAGATLSWPDWAKATVAFMLPVGSLCAMLLAANGLGFLSSEILASVGERRAPTAGQWIAVYLGMFVVLLGVNALLVFTAHVDWARTALIECGLLFLLASSGRSWWLLGTIRRAGWFGYIESDTVIRWLLGAVGVLLVVSGLLHKGA